MEILLSSIVVQGRGFTPQLINAPILENIIPGHAEQAISAPPLSILDYPDGYQVMVQENRFDIKRQRPPEGADNAMQEAVLHLLGLWPLVKPEAIGVNFQMGGAYEEESVTQAGLLARFVPTAKLEEIVGDPLIGTKHSFSFKSEAGKVTIELITDALIAERPGFTLDFNVHHQPVPDTEAVVRSQGEWHKRVMGWSERLIEESW